MELTAHTLRRLRLLCEPGAFRPEEVAESGRDVSRTPQPGGLRGLRRGELCRAVHRHAGAQLSVRAPASGARRAGPARYVAPGTGHALSVLGDEGVLFNEAKGTLHRLNQAAAHNWCALEAGWGWQRIAADAAAARGIGCEAAMAELRELAAHWIGEGLLRDTAATQAAGAARSFALRLPLARLPDAGHRGAAAGRRRGGGGAGSSGFRAPGSGQRRIDQPRR